MNELDKELENKFLSKEKFAEGVEQLVRDQGINYIDAVVEYCEQNSIEIESAGKLIPKQLKEKIRCDAARLHYLTDKPRPAIPFS